VSDGTEWLWEEPFGIGARGNGSVATAYRSKKKKGGVGGERRSNRFRGRHLKKVSMPSRQNSQENKRAQGRDNREKVEDVHLVKRSQRNVAPKMDGEDLRRKDHAAKKKSGLKKCHVRCRKGGHRLRS